MKKNINLFERAIRTIAPRIAYKRHKARIGLELIEKRKYEGASQKKRFKDFRAPGTSANDETLSGLVILRNRARDLVRNNPLATSAVDKLESHLIGDGIVPQFFLYDNEALGGQKLLSLIQKEWYKFAESNEFSPDGLLNFYGTQMLGSRSEIEGGESISRLIYNKNTKTGIQIQLLEPDFLDQNKNERLTDGGKIIQGVEYNKLGQRVAYWLFADHPGDSLSNYGSSFRVDASTVHCSFDPWRIGQVRGVPWLAPTIVKLRDFDKYQDFQLLRQEIAAAFVGIIERSVEDDSEPQVDEFDAIEPGLFYKASPGEKLTFSDPPKLDGYKDFSLITSQHIAAGLGVTYEAITGDYSQVNYTSSRASKYDLMGKMKKCRIKYVYPKLNKYYDWFLLAQKLKGNDFSNVGVNWIPPRVQLLDPLKEISANAKAIESGQTSLSQVIRESGHDPDEVFNEIALERKKLKDLGISLTFLTDETQPQELPNDEEK